MGAEPPFKVGDRVRMKAGQRRVVRFREGVVTRLRRQPYFLGGHNWWVYVQRDWASQKSPYFFVVSEDGRTSWELVPLSDYTQDETAKALARAVLAGDFTAAGPLADRVAALINGTE